MGVSGGWAFSYGRGTPVGLVLEAYDHPKGGVTQASALDQISGDATPCKLTPVILHGVVENQA